MISAPSKLQNGGANLHSAARCCRKRTTDAKGVVTSEAKCYTFRLIASNEVRLISYVLIRPGSFDVAGVLFQII